MVAILSAHMQSRYFTERPKSLYIHTQRSVGLNLCGSFKINASKGGYAIYPNVAKARELQRQGVWG